MQSPPFPRYLVPPRSKYSPLVLREKLLTLGNTVPHERLRFVELFMTFLTFHATRGALLCSQQSANVTTLN